MASKQLSLFSKKSETDPKKVGCDDPQAWQLFTDGASRNNPGPSGVGFTLKKDGKPSCEQGFFIGSKTNNQAEYIALVSGIFFAKKFIKKSDKLSIFCDSQLIVRQMNGQYRVKDAQLKKLQIIAYDLLKGYQYSFCHVYRSDNARADELANRGLDKKVTLPKELKEILLNVGMA